MPRIRDSASDPRDLCSVCFPKTEVAAFRRYGFLGDGPDERGNCFVYDDEHPCYADEVYTEDGRRMSDYTCEVCGCVLGARDEGTQDGASEDKTAPHCDTCWCPLENGVCMNIYCPTKRAAKGA